MTGNRRLFIHRTTEVTGAVEDADGVTVSTHNLMTGESGTVRADALVCATGFEPGDIRDLLGDAASSCVFADGRPVVGRDYRLTTTADTCVGDLPQRRRGGHARTVVDAAVEHRGPGRRDRRLGGGAQPNRHLS